MPTIRGPPVSVSFTSVGVEVSFSHGFVLRVQVLERDVVRVALGQPQVEERRSWMVVDSSGDVPYQGRDKTDLSRFSKDALKGMKNKVEENGTIELESEHLMIRAFVKEDVRIECIEKSTGLLFFADAAFDAYRYGEDGGTFRHTLKSNSKTEEYYGFGECSGLLKKNFQRLRVDAKDCMGYDAETSDPLYKHWPYHVTLVNRGDSPSTCYGMLYDTMRRSVFDLGRFGASLHAFGINV